MFEKTHGTEDDVEEVKNKAKIYVEGVGAWKTGMWMKGLLFIRNLGYSLI